MKYKPIEIKNNVITPNTIFNDVELSESISGKIPPKVPVIHSTVASIGLIRPLPRQVVDSIPLSKAAVSMCRLKLAILSRNPLIEIEISHDQSLLAQ
jgi:hypothetical protein